jgi:hypothetical protein
MRSHAPHRENELPVKIFSSFIAPMAGPPNELVLHGYSPGGDWGAGDKTVPGFSRQKRLLFLESCFHECWGIA